jgi:hypothetical protein
MDSEQFVRILLTVVTPILTAGVGIAALVIGDWRERRTQAGQRKLAFEDASRQVEFAKDWWNASKLIAASPATEQSASAQAQAWLDEASALVTEYKQSPADDGGPTITLRRLLLAFPMQRRGARILRGFYYFVVGVVLLQVSGALASAFGRTDSLGIPNYFSDGQIYVDLLGIFVYTLVAMMFRFWSLRVEEARSADSPHRRITLSNMLLVYPFNGSRAHIARIVYWLWLVFTAAIVVLIVISAFQDPGVLPSNLVAVVAWAGWAVGLRYWAVSQDERARAVMPSPATD